MNVAVVMGSYHGDNVGGAELQSHIIAHRLMESGHNAVYVAVRGTSDDASEKGAVPVIGLSDPSVSERVRDLSGLLRDMDADVCYTRSFGDLAVTAAAANEAGVPLVIHISSDSMTSPRAPFDSLAKLRSSRYATHRGAFRLMLEAPARLICQTQFQASRIAPLWPGDPSHVVVLPNLWRTPVDAFAPLNTRDAILWIGPAKPVKRPGLYLSLVRGARVEGARFLMVGRFEDSRLARRVGSLVASGRLQTTGVLTPGQVDDVFRETAMLVNTSRYEGFPNTFLQAFAQGVPVVTAGVDPDGVLLANSMGLVADNASALVEHVQRLWADSELRNAMGDRARGYLERGHAIDRWWPAYESLLLEVAEGDSAGGRS